MKIYEIRSGQQAGNLNPDITVWTKSPVIAKTLLASVQAYAQKQWAHKQGNWVWGPNTYTHDSKEEFGKVLMTEHPEVTSANLNDWLEL